MTVVSLKQVEYHYEQVQNNDYIKMAQVLGKKFKKLSWTKFVDMIINNELSLHNEFGEYH